MNLTELLDNTVRHWPQKEALIDGESVVSYAGLAEKVDALAAELRRLNPAPGCRVGLCLGNSIDYIALTFALWRVNAVVVPIPTECTAAETEEIAQMTGLEGIIGEKPATGGTRLSSGACFTRLKPEMHGDNSGLNIAFIRFTSGTTSARKGVVLTHESIRDRVVAANQAFQIGPEDTVMWCLPMAHHFLITIVLYLSRGATIVLARHVLARPFVEAVNRWRGTVLYAAPFHYALLARDNSDLGMPSVRLAVSTTCALQEDVAEAFRERFKLPLSQALGIIELGLVSLNTEDPVRRWNSVGRPVAGFNVRIVSADEDGCGEVAIRGRGFFDAYLVPWMPRGDVLRDGWFRTGDIGRIDEDGFVFLAGRKTAVINLAGRKVFPEEIEAVLNRHPAVQESRVYGRAHPQLGEVVEADVVMKQPGTDLESVRNFCREHLGPHKTPTRLHQVGSLPRTAVTGKIRRTAAVA